MRILAVAAIVIGSCAPAYAQADSPAPSAAAPSEGIAFGALLTPALEGGGPWFMSGLRLSLPLGARHVLDVDAGRIDGGESSYGSFRRFASAQVRFYRGPRESESPRRYWIGGLQYLPETESDGRRKHHNALVIGHGWSQAFRNGARVLGEVGFSVGDGFLIYVTTAVQWAPWGSRGS